jgi:hypothetical protein
VLASFLLAPLLLFTPLRGAGSAANRRRGKTRRRGEHRRQFKVKRKNAGKKKRRKSPPAPPGPPSPPPPCAQSCGGCCTGETCHAGTSAQACGRNGAPCVTCANPTPACAGQVCAACSVSTQCPAGTLCLEDVCQTCDVCGSGCSYATPTEAVADPAGPATIRLCPGIYQAHLTIRRDVHLIGAGNGNRAGDTILDGAGSVGVVTVIPGFRVTLQRLRITGAAPHNDGGSITNTGSFLTLRDCLVTGNSATYGGGIDNRGYLELDHSEITLNDAQSGGGVYNRVNCTAILRNGSTISRNSATSPPGISGGGIFNQGTVDASGGSISGNHPDDCVDGLFGAGCPP